MYTNTTINNNKKLKKQNGKNCIYNLYDKFVTGRQVQ